MSGVRWPLAKLLPWCLLCAAALSGATSCNTDAAVFVEADIESSVVTVSQGALGTNIAGTFTLTLHLGARASGPSEITLGSFSIKNEAGDVLLDTLPVISDRPSPITVNPDTDESVTFAIDSGGEPLDEDLYPQLCAGKIVISGVVDDSLDPGPNPVDSEPFTATGCP
jgi:hypothetical protein